MPESVCARVRDKTRVLFFYSGMRWCTRADCRALDVLGEQCHFGSVPFKRGTQVCVQPIAQNETDTKDAPTWKREMALEKKRPSALLPVKLQFGRESKASTGWRSTFHLTKKGRVKLTPPKFASGRSMVRGVLHKFHFWRSIILGVLFLTMKKWLLLRHCVLPRPQETDFANFIFDLPKTRENCEKSERFVLGNCKNLGWAEGLPKSTFEVIVAGVCVKKSFFQNWFFGLEFFCF